MNISQESLAQWRDALAKDPEFASQLRKAFTASGTATSGLTYYSLEAPSKKLFPVLTPIRNMVPRVSGGRGIQANWRAVTGINTGRTSVGVTEGNRGGVTTTTTSDNFAIFRGIGLEDYVTFEAEYAGEGFEDIRALAATNLLKSLMIGEESVLLGGLGTWALGANGLAGRTPTPVGTLVTGAGDMTAQATLCFCVALTLDGYLRSTIAGGLPGQLSRTSGGPMVNTDTINGGNAKVSLVSNTITTAAANLAVDWTVDAVPGAYAYAWYTGPTGASTCALTAITTLNVFNQLHDAAGTQKANDTKIAADYSQDSTVFDGLTSLANKAGSNSYYRSLDGAALTANNDGSIEEIDVMLEAFWGTGQTGNLRLSPDTFWVSGADARQIGQKVASGASAPIARVIHTASEEGIRGGGFKWVDYLNRITGDVITVKISPDMPPGKLLATTSTLPYALNNVPAVFRVLCRQEYYELEWPRVRRTYDYGVYADEVLQHYFPPSLGTLDNFGPGKTII